MRDGIGAAKSAYPHMLVLGMGKSKLNVVPHRHPTDRKGVLRNLTRREYVHFEAVAGNSQQNGLRD